MLAASNGITREAADAFAARSHANAHAAWENGTLDAEVISIDVPGRKGAVTTVDNSSQQNDAAAGFLVVSKAYLDKHGLTPMGGLWAGPSWAAIPSSSAPARCPPRKRYWNVRA